MKGFSDNIENLTIENENFRKVLYTGKYSQLVVMTIQPGDDIGSEVHDGHDQFFRIEQGVGKAIIDGVEHELADGTAIVVPSGAQHNIINTGDEALRLYTIYSPPEHRDGVVHATKEEALDDEEHFDGTTTE